MSSVNAITGKQATADSTLQQQGKEEKYSLPEADDLVHHLRQHRAPDRRLEWGERVGVVLRMLKQTAIEVYNILARGVAHTFRHKQVGSSKTAELPSLCLPPVDPEPVEPSPAAPSIPVGAASVAVAAPAVATLQKGPSKAEQWRDHCERIKQLRFDELTIGREEAPATARDFLQYRELYDKNVLSPEAFFYLAQGEMDEFKNLVRRGGMGNLFQPEGEVLQRYRELYGADYESVHDQTFRDLQGRWDPPGWYRAFGLRERVEGPLRAAITLRMPPLCPDRMKDYVGYLRERHRHLDIQKPWTRSDLSKMYPRMGELDTINADPDLQWRGAGRWLMLQLLRRLEEEWSQKESLAMIYYRGGGFEVVEPRVCEFKGFSPNDSSYKLFYGCGFSDYASRCEKEDVDVMEAPNQGIVQYRRRWEYGILPNISEGVKCAESHWDASEQNLRSDTL